MRTLEPDAPAVRDGDDVDATPPHGLARPPAPSLSPTHSPAPTRSRVASYDGLRGLAMVLVLLSHVWVLMPAGFRGSLGLAAGPFHSGSLGVIVFLVLGASLVTTSVLERRDATGRVDVVRFWVRRLVRIGAPLVAMLVVVTVVAWAEGFPSSSPRATLTSIAAILTSSFNWLLIDRPSASRADLGHLWYLSVEQQFYVVWIIVLAVVGRSRRHLPTVLGVAAAGVFVWRLFVWDRWGWWPASLRTDTRIDAMLLGAAIGVVAVRTGSIGRWASRRWVVPIGVLVMTACVLATGGDTTAFLGGIGAVFVAATAMVVHGLSVGGGRNTRALSWPALRGLGSISYPVYLWHYPIFYAVARWGRDWPTPVRLAVAGGILVAAVAASRALVERPVGRWLERSEGRAPPRQPRSDRARFVVAAAWGAAVAAVPFTMALWDFGIRPLRTAIPTRIFSNFYDLQARALMGGDLDLPLGATSIEAFRIDGHDYMYFPPGPALLRIPVLAATDAFDGRLTALSMLLAWCLLVVFVALLLWRVRCILRPGTPLGRREAVAHGALIAVIAGGSVVTYLAALPWVYHEVYIWATAMAVGATWAIIGILQRPSAGRVAAAFGLALGAILSRTTSGWAICLTLIAVGVMLAVSPARRDQRRWAAPVIAAAVVPLAVGAVVNWAKFRHPFLFPLEDQVWTTLNEHRREALAANGGGLLGPQFFPTSLVNYFRPDGIRFTGIFPYVTLPADPARPVGGAFVDQTYRTGSVTAFMPLLVALGGWGLLQTFRRHAGDRMATLRLPVLGTIAITAGVMFYGYVAHRYTAEFVPALVLLSAIGLVDLARRAPSWSSRRRSMGVAAFAALAGFGLLANAAVAVGASRQTARGEALEQLIDVRLTLSEWTGRPNDRYVERAATLDQPAPADRLRIVRDCEAVYLASGDQYEPWIPVDLRGVDVRVTVTGRGGDRPGRLPLVMFNGVGQRSIVLDHDGRGNYRLVVEGGGAEARGDWYALERGATFRFDVRAAREQSEYVIDAPVYLFTSVPMADWNEDWLSVPSEIALAPVPSRAQEAVGVVVDARWVEPSPFCTRLLDAVGGVS